MDFQSYSLSISYRISNVVHGGVWIFSGIAQSAVKTLKSNWAKRSQIGLGHFDWESSWAKESIWVGTYVGDPQSKFKLMLELHCFSLLAP